MRLEARSIGNIEMAASTFIFFCRVFVRLGGHVLRSYIVCWSHQLGLSCSLSIDKVQCTVLSLKHITFSYKKLKKLKKLSTCGPVSMCQRL